MSRPACVEISNFEKVEKNIISMNKAEMQLFWVNNSWARFLTFPNSCGTSVCW